MRLDAERLRKLQEFIERADSEQFDTQDFQMAKSLGQWYVQYVAELKKENPSRARIEQLMSDLDAKLDSFDATNDTSDRPSDAVAH